MHGLIRKNSTDSKRDSNLSKKSSSEMTTNELNNVYLYNSNEDNTKNKGVWYNARTRCWLACVKENGRHLRVFSVKKYGFSKAKMLALECKNKSYLNVDYLKNNSNETKKNENSEYIKYKKEKTDSLDRYSNANSDFNSSNSSKCNIKNDKISKDMKDKNTYNSNENENFDTSNRKRRYNTRRKHNANDIKDIKSEMHDIKKIKRNVYKPDIKSELNIPYDDGLEEMNYKVKKEIYENINFDKNSVIDNSYGKNVSNMDLYECYKSSNANYSDSENYRNYKSNIYMNDIKKNTNDSNENTKNYSNCLITDKDFQIDSPEQNNEDLFFFKPLAYDDSDTLNTQKKNDNETKILFSNEYHSDMYNGKNNEDYKFNFIDLTREALALILQDLKKNVVPKVPVANEKKERYTNSLRLCLRNAKITKHFNELEPYLELFSECIKNSKLPSHMDLQDQLFYLDKL